MSQEKSTKEKIIEAAKELFLAKGFAGASMGQIRKDAGVNHSLLFYHFKNKENLWLEVKHNIAAQSGNRVIPDSNLKFAEFIKAIFKNSVNYYKHNSDLVKILNWQRLESISNSAIGVALSEEMQRWIKVFNDYKDKGEMQKDVRPEFIISMILSLTSSAAMDNYYFLTDQNQIDLYIDFCSDAVLKACEVRLP